MKLSNSALRAVTAIYCQIDRSSKFDKKDAQESRRSLAAMLDATNPGWRLIAVVESDAIDDDAVVDEIEGWIKSCRPALPHLKTEQSRSRRALRAFLPLPTGHGTLPPDGVWAEYLGTHPSSCGELRAFAGICSRSGVAPGAVTNAHIRSHFEAHLDDRLESGARIAIRRLVAALNKLRPVGCREERFRVPGARVRKPKPTFNPALVAEAEKWRSTRVSGSEQMKPILPRTAKHEIDKLLAFTAEYAEATHRRAEEISSFSILLSKSAAEPVIERMKQRSTEADPIDGWGANAYDHALSLARMARHAAIFGLEQSEARVKELEELARTYSPKREGLSRKQRDMLRRYCNQSRFDELQDLPFMVARELCGRTSLSHRERSALTAAFAMQLTMEVPQLPCTLASIERSQIVEAGAGADRIVTIHAPADDCRAAGQALGELGPGTVEMLDGYVRLVLEADGGSTGSFLFPGRGARSKHPARFSRQISDLVRARLHYSVTATDLPFIMAFATLASDPHGRDLAAGYLGHKHRQALDDLVDLVEGWRRSGALETWNS